MDILLSHGDRTRCLPASRQAMAVVRFLEGRVRMKYREYLETRSGVWGSAEFEFLMDEYAMRLGCAPPVRLLGQLPAIMANALLTRSIIIKKPIEEIVGCLPSSQGLDVLSLVAGAGAPECLADLR